MSERLFSDEFMYQATILAAILKFLVCVAEILENFERELFDEHPL